MTTLARKSAEEGLFLRTYAAFAAMSASAEQGEPEAMGRGRAGRGPDLTRLRGSSRGELSATYR